MDLDGRVALIPGGGGAIGSAIAEALATATTLEDLRPEEHPHKPGLHGGIIVPIGRDSYHAEAVFETGGTLRLYTLGQDEGLAQRIVEAEDDRVDRQLHGRPAPQRAEVEDLLGQVVEDRPGPCQVIRLATGHDRQLAALGERHAARDRGVQDAGPRAAGGIGEAAQRGGRNGAHVDEQ